MTLISVVLLFSNSFLLSLLLFSMSLSNRSNSDSEDEDSGSTIFSRIQKEQCRLDGNCQRSSLLLELATQRAIKSWNTHAARRSSGVSEEPRCSCLLEPACLGIWPQIPAAAHFCYINLGSDYAQSWKLNIFSTKA